MDAKGQVSWLPILAQQPPQGFTAEQAADAIGDQAQNQASLVDPANYGRNIGRLALINQLLSSPEFAQLSRTVPGADQQFADLANKLRSEIDREAYNDVDVVGDPAVLEPRLLQDFFSEMAKLRDEASLVPAQEAAIQTTNDAAAQGEIKGKFQSLVNQLNSQLVQTRAPVAPGKAFFASASRRQAQAAPAQAAPEDASPMQAGPLVVPKYKSEDQLEADINALGPYPETYERMLDLVDEDDEDSAKSALAAFFQGFDSGLSMLYSLLVKAGMASPINEERVMDMEQRYPQIFDEKDDGKKKDASMNGLFLPPADSGLHTTSSGNDKMEKQASGGVGGPNAAYMTHGPGENRYCPKLRNVVNTYICRYHCLDGLPIDDHQVLCGEAIWRQSVMDKYSREYRDADGNWTGGYINKRFEVHRDTGGHPCLLKPNQRHAPIHEDAWNMEKRLQEMRRAEAGERGYSETPGDPEGLYNFDQHDLSKGPKNPQLSEKSKDDISKIAETSSAPPVKFAQSMFRTKENPFRTEGMDPHELLDNHMVHGVPLSNDELGAIIGADIANFEDFEQRGESYYHKKWLDPKRAPTAVTAKKKGKKKEIERGKKDWNPNPWAVCHTTVDKDEDPEKYEECVHKVKRKQSSSWLPKVAQMNMPKTTAGTKCNACGWNGGDDVRNKPCPQCGAGVMQVRDQMAAQMETGSLAPEDTFHPLSASGEAELVIANGVFRMTKDGSSTYGSSISEAQKKMDDLSKLAPGTVQEESADIAKFMDGNGQSPPAAPSWMPAPRAPVVDSTPSTRELPMSMVPRAEEVQGGQSMFEEEAGPHASAEDLDLYLASDQLSQDEEEKQEVQEQMDSLGGGPDPSFA